MFFHVGVAGIVLPGNFWANMWATPLTSKSYLKKSTYIYIVMSRVRNYTFTVNNYVEDSLDRLKEDKHCQYVIAGCEVGAEGTQHLQGYVQFNDKMRFTAVKALMPTAHIEVAIASDLSNYNYCTKDGNLFLEHGTRKKQGKRNDIHSACAMIDEGCNMREVATLNPVVYVKYNRGLEKYKAIMLDPRTEAPEVTVLYGPTGSGKSKTARGLLLEDPYIWGPEQEKWFDGYEGQQETIFEEFRGQLPLGMMLRLLDRYDCRVQTKGGTIQFVSTKIVITSPTHPREWYCTLFSDGEDKLAQLLRRITEIKMLK